MKPKDPLLGLKQKGVVYEIPYEDCGVRYIGETGRSINIRRKEHVQSDRLGKSESSALAQHVEEQDHRIAWDATRIFVKENKWTQMKWKEAWLIESTKNAIANGHHGRIPPEMYRPIFGI